MLGSYSDDLALECVQLRTGPNHRDQRTRAFEALELRDLDLNRASLDCAEAVGEGFNAFRCYAAQKLQRQVPAFRL